MSCTKEFDAIADAVTGVADFVAPIAAVIPGPWQPFAYAYNAADAALEGDILGAATSALGAYNTIPTGGLTPAQMAGPVMSAGYTAPGIATGAGGAGSWVDTLGQLVGGGGGGVQLTAEQVASLAGNPEALAAYKAAGMLPSTTSWMDYISTGLGIVQGIQGVTGGNNLDASQIQNMVDPFAPYRAGYASQLNTMMANPAAIIPQMPGYQFLQDQGQQAVMRQLAAQGRTVSGQEQLALQQQGQGLANQFYNDQYNKLAQLSGASASPAQGGVSGATALQANQQTQNLGLEGLMGTFNGTVKEVS